MAGNGENNYPSYLYLGLAGETGRGRVVHSGLFRLADGGGEWQALERGLPETPAVRALAVHPQKPEIVYAGTQSGAYRSADRGEHWEKVEMPDHGLPVWSVLFHPHDPDEAPPAAPRRTASRRPPRLRPARRPWGGGGGCGAMGP